MLLMLLRMHEQVMRDTNIYRFEIRVSGICQESKVLK